jgi:hypothetical protein
MLVQPGPQRRWSFDITGDMEWRQDRLNSSAQGNTFSDTEAILRRIGMLVVALQQFERDDLLGLD